MDRKKVKLQWIANNGARKAAYKKRVTGLVKKVRELSILCGVNARLMAYRRYHLQPEVWPSPAEAERVVATFRQRPESDHSKLVLNQEMFTSQKIMKGKDDLVKELKKNRKKEIEILKTQCLGGMMMQGLEKKDHLDLIWAIDDDLEAAKKWTAVVPWLEAAGEAGCRAYNAGAGIGDIPTVDASTSIGAVFHVGAGDIPAGRAAFTSTDAASDVPVSLIGDADVAAADQPMDDLFNFAFDDLNNQMLPKEQNQNEIMGNASGDPLGCDVSDFWLNPYIL